jgi:ribosomal protein L40E
MENHSALITLILSICLIVIESLIPIILILILGFFLWQFAGSELVNFLLATFIYKRNPLVKSFYEQIIQVAEARGRKIARVIRLPVYFIIFIMFLTNFSPYFPYKSQIAESLLKETIPRVSLAFGIIFISYGILLSIIASFVYLGEMKKSKISNRGMEIYLLGSYVGNITKMILFATILVGGFQLWSHCLSKLLPIFGFLERLLSSSMALENNYSQLLELVRSAYDAFRNEFKNWGIVGFLLVLSGFAIPYMQFKGKRYSVIFLSIFLSSTVLSYAISLLIQKFVSSELTAVFVVVWLFCGLITYTAFHLIKNISLTKITICQHCQTENSPDSKYCKECGRQVTTVSAVNSPMDS